jgi:hypothetical protein
MNYILKIQKEYIKFKKKIDKINKINSIINLKDELFDIWNKPLVFSNNNIYNNSNIVNNKTILLSPVSKYLISILSYIKDNDILIITSNISFIDLVYKIYSDVNVTVILFNIKTIGEYIKLKEMYKNINIYYIGLFIDYNVILKIIKNTKYDSILIDSGTNNNDNHQLKIVSSATLLSNDNLKKDGILIMYCYLPYENNFYTYCFNLLYKQFTYHSINLFKSTIITAKTYVNLFVFLKKYDNISINNKEKILNYLNNNKINLNEEENNYNKYFLQNIYIRWKQLNFDKNEILLYLKQQYNIKKKIKRLSYHNQSILIRTSNLIIPETINDLIYDTKYIHEGRDFQSRCHWGQKKLLLSEIQFLTKVCKKLNIKSLNNYAVVYVGSADGRHLPILYDMFPDLLWLLYDPGKFSNESRMHKDKNKVKIFNQFFTDDTIEHVKKNAENRKILFISDIRLSPSEESVMKDMISQAKWGTDLEADFMLLKYKPPYDTENTDTYKTNNIDDLQINKKYISNPDLQTNKNEKYFLYLKGDIYIQLYAHIHSVELRLMVEKINGKYELDKVKYSDIEQKMFYFNIFTRVNWHNDKIYDFLNYIPGYDSSIECVMEYFIIKNYYEYIHNITDNNIIIQKIFDMALIFEKLSHNTFYNCNYNTMIRTFNKFNKEENKDNDKLERIKLWKDISKLNIDISINKQIDIIKNEAREILGKERFDKAIKYLEKYKNNDNKKYIIF